MTLTYHVLNTLAAIRAVFGVDYQILVDTWGEQPIQDMQALKDNGVAGVILRLNDMNGGHHMDEGFLSQWDAAGGVGLLRAPYFVYNPWVSGAENFDWLKTHAPACKLVMSDVEVAYPGYSRSAYAAQVKDYDYLVKANNWNEIIYTGQWFLQYLSSWPAGDYCWAAYPSIVYPGSAEQWSWEQLKAALDTLTVPSNLYSIPGVLKWWQCSGDRLILPGSSHPIDIIITRMSQQQLNDYLGGEIEPPTPDPGGTMQAQECLGKTVTVRTSPAVRTGNGTSQSILPRAKVDYVAIVPDLDHPGDSNYQWLQLDAAGMKYANYYYPPNGKRFELLTPPPPPPATTPKVVGATIRFDDGSSQEMVPSP